MKEAWVDEIYEAWCIRVCCSVHVQLAQLCPGHYHGTLCWTRGQSTCKLHVSWVSLANRCLPGWKLDAGFREVCEWIWGQATGGHESGKTNEFVLFSTEFSQAYAEAFRKFDVDESPRLSENGLNGFIYSEKRKYDRKCKDAKAVSGKTDGYCEWFLCTDTKRIHAIMQYNTNWSSESIDPSPMSKSWTNMKRSDPTWCVRDLRFEWVVVVLNRCVTKSSWTSSQSGNLYSDCTPVSQVTKSALQSCRRFVSSTALFGRSQWNTDDFIVSQVLRSLGILVSPSLVTEIMEKAGSDHATLRRATTRRRRGWLWGGLRWFRRALLWWVRVVPVTLLYGNVSLGEFWYALVFILKKPTIKKRSNPILKTARPLAWEFGDTSEWLWMNWYCLGCRNQVLCSGQAHETLGGIRWLSSSWTGWVAAQAVWHH